MAFYIERLLTTKDSEFFFIKPENEDLDMRYNTISLAELKLATQHKIYRGEYFKYIQQYLRRLSGCMWSFATTYLMKKNLTGLRLNILKQIMEEYNLQDYIREFEEKDFPNLSYNDDIIETISPPIALFKSEGETIYHYVKHKGELVSNLEPEMQELFDKAFRKTKRVGILGYWYNLTEGRKFKIIESRLGINTVPFLFSLVKGRGVGGIFNTAPTHEFVLRRLSRVSDIEFEIERNGFIAYTFSQMLKIIYDHPQAKTFMWRNKLYTDKRLQLRELYYKGYKKIPRHYLIFEDINGKEYSFRKNKIYSDTPIKYQLEEKYYAIETRGLFFITDKLEEYNLLNRGNSFINYHYEVGRQLYEKKKEKELNG